MLDFLGLLYYDPGVRTGQTFREKYGWALGRPKKTNWRVDKDICDSTAYKLHQSDS